MSRKKPSKVSREEEMRTLLKSTTALNLGLLYDLSNMEFKKIVNDLLTRRRDARAGLVVDRFTLSLLESIVPNAKQLVGELTNLQNGEPVIQQYQLNTVIFSIYPSPASLASVAKIIKGTKDLDVHFYVIYTSRQTMIASQLLKEQGVAEYIRGSETWQINMIPIENDVITMEMPFAFSQYNVHNDKTPLFDVARAIMQLQMTFGLIPKIVGKGKAAKDVWDIVRSMTRELSEPPLIAPEIDSLVIIDRMEDAITPLCSQMTYEGLIDEIFSISLGKLRLPPEVWPDENTNAKFFGVLPLNSSIKIFNDLRSLPWQEAVNIISRRSKLLREQTAQGRSEMSTREMGQFVKLFRSHIEVEQTHLPIHTNIAHSIKGTINRDEFEEKFNIEHELLGVQKSGKLSTMTRFLKGEENPVETADEYIEDCISRQESVLRVLRLLCLRSLITGGFKPDKLEFFRREVLQTYGFEFSLTLDNLAAAGLFVEQTKQSHYADLSRAFGLVADVPEDWTQVEDYHFVYMGYCPLSIRIMEQLLDTDHSLLHEYIPDDILKEKQRLPPGLRPKGSDDSQQRDPVTVVCFVGGVTQAEIAALRFLSRHKRREYVVLTTDIVTGTRLLRNLREPVEKNERLSPSKSRH
eukprot:m.52018 g.52018  ORF g.52018 m.52018 type:complete len:635 (-) comp7596_c0_seq2:1480-3384(-)